MNEILLRPQFNKLKMTEKLTLMQSLADCYNMTFQSLYVFTRWGQSCTTGIFEKAGREFAFVPGDTVTLGWNQFAVGPEQNCLAELKHLLEEYSYEGSPEHFLRQYTLPVRVAELPPMLVGRNLEEIGWEPVSFWDSRLQEEHREWLEAFWRHEHSGIQKYNIVGCAKFERFGTRWQAYLQHKVTYPQLKETLKEQGFSLPTADEWSYLCGGGCRTLFPWGECIDASMHLRHYEAQGDPRPYDLEEPNFFGLYIAYDPYKQEVVESDSLTTCGGDGGCGVCGGLEPMLSYLPCSPHYRPDMQKDNVINSDYKFYRPVITIR